jgi:hypothetical protein
LFFRTLLVLCYFTTHLAFAQETIANQPISVSKGEVLLDFISGMERRTNLKFFYREEWLEPFAFTRDYTSGTLDEALTEVLQDSDIRFIFLYDYAIVFYKDPQRELERDAIKESAINRQVKVDEFVIGTPRTFVPGTQVLLKGAIVDNENNAPIVGATVFVNGLDVATQSDAEGQYQMLIPGGEYIINFRHINYEEKLLSLSIYADGQVNTLMEETPTTLEAVVISDQRITTRKVGLTTINMDQLTRSPTFLGETDVIRILQTQTGVSTVSEASTGYNVRGGGVDQNLVLFDGVPIFNTAHAFGFFTAFNSDAIREASFYKGGIPAEYGGRVSSVLSMTSREGDYQKWKGSAGIGFISSNLTVGGPVKKDTSSLIVSLRSTYSDWILDLLQTNYQGIQESSVSFYDGSIKYSQKLKNGSKLTLSSYVSKDRFKLSNDTINKWQNLAVALRYDNKLNQELYYSIGVNLGRYSYNVSETDPPTAFELSYSILYPSIKVDFNRDGKHKQTFGMLTTYYNFKPGSLRATSAESNIADITMPAENSVEAAVYFSEMFSVSDRLSVEAGLRLSMFSRIGPATVFTYESDKPLEPRNIADSILYSSGEVIKTYGGPEPRLSLNYRINPNSSLKLGYNRIYQYIHLVSNTAAVTPVDIWQSSNTYFNPQLGDQLSFGYFRNSKNSMYESYIEVYGKKIQNILDFKDGASLILNPQLETALLPGDGVAYGIEFAIDKTKGRLVGGINYTYSRSLRKIDGVFESEKINNGNYYPSNFDQPNIVNVNWRYSIKRNIFFSGIFTYHTGRPISIPLAAYEINAAPIIDFSERNNYRLPDYHRLDLALIIEGGNKRIKKINGQWTISVYNIYGRRNPYSAFFDYNVAGAVKPYQLSLIGVPVPSVSYGIKF